MKTIVGGLDGDKDSAIELTGYDGNSTKSSPKALYQQQQQQQMQMLSPNATLNTSMDSISQAQLTSGNLSKYTKLKGNELYMQQLGALFLKRFHHYRRNMRILATNILLPVIFVAMSMMFTTIRPKLTYQPPLELSPVIYDPSNIFYT
jgi:hypothetical protein